MKVRRSWHSELPLPRGERVGVRGFGRRSKNSDCRTPSTCPSPLWGEGTQLAGHDLIATLPKAILDFKFSLRFRFAVRFKEDSAPRRRLICTAEQAVA
jgi:hypothetical protein